MIFGRKSEWSSGWGGKHATKTPVEGLTGNTQKGCRNRLVAIGAPERLLDHVTLRFLQGGTAPRIVYERIGPGQRMALFRV